MTDLCVDGAMNGVLVLLPLVSWIAEILEEVHQTESSIFFISLLVDRLIFNFFSFPLPRERQAHSADKASTDDYQSKRKVLASRRRSVEKKEILMFHI